MLRQTEDIEYLFTEDYMNAIKNKKRKQRLKGIYFLCFLLLLISIGGILFYASKSEILNIEFKKILAGNRIFTEPIESITINGEGYSTNTAGSWKIDKSAKWTKENEAEIVFKVNTIPKPTNNHKKDIVLVIDNSGSMSGKKLEMAKEDAKELVEAVLSDTSNKIGLITFNSDSTIEQTLTNNKTTLNSKIDAITDTGCTNYNAALNKVLEILNNYEKQSNRDLVTLFMTDGYPNEDTPNQIGTYEIIKDKYSYMKIAGIQYELGKEIIDDIKNISDEQYIADRDNLGNVLMEAAIASEIYDTFRIEDYLEEYFDVDSIDDIEVDMGDVTLTNNKVTWIIENFTTGKSATMKIKIKLKSAYRNLSDTTYFPTNEEEIITSKLPEGSASSITRTDTPVLANEYSVIYDKNLPTGCEIDTNIPTTKHKPFEQVEISNTKLSCSDYTFKGWEVENDVKYVNDEMFIMPAEDVTVRGVWKKHTITKTMDGTVYEKHTLYKQVMKDATENNLGGTYTGSHQDTLDNSGEETIYYYSGNVSDKNNVRLGDKCFQMLRTTDTGGVKMIYNGEYDETNKCNTSRSTHKGVIGAQVSTKNLNGSYQYGDSYTYDETTGVFTLTNPTTATWSDSTYQSLLGKYTCASTSNTCTTLYNVNGYSNSTTAYTTSYTIGDTHYSQIGTSAFNANYYSPAMVGYMYNTVYNDKSKTMSTSTETMLSRTSLNTTYWYANSVTWGSPTASRYNLDSPYQVSSTSDYPNLVGKYTFMNTSQTYTNTSVYYIAAVNGTNMYYIQLTNSGNHTLADFNYTYTYGDSYTDNGDGTYTINSPTTINRSDWYTNYNNVKNKYVCKNATNNTCSELRYTIATSNTSVAYINVIQNNYKYAKGFEYRLDPEDNTYKYFLNDDSVTFFNISGSTNKTSLNTHHYTCWNTTGKCTNISYIFYLDGTTPYYIDLIEGKSIDDAKNEMLYNNDVNRYNSSMKGVIEAWYHQNMTGYTDYLEDVIYCNDRSQTNESTNGWNPDGGSLTTYMYFKDSSTNTTLKCNNETDQFTTTNTKATLRYPVGLATYPEMNLLNNSNARKTGQQYWLFSPRYFSYRAYVRYVSTAGALNGNYVVSYPNGSRPAVSLKPEVEYTEGDGSMNNPYVVDLGD